MELVDWSIKLIVSAMSALVILAIGFVIMFLITGILNLIKKWRPTK